MKKQENCRILGLRGSPMPRKSRQQEPGDIHYVMSHGIDSLNLFETEQDCLKFQEILQKNFEKYDCRCYGFIFMRNHYHILIRPSGDTLSLVMRAINNTYARYLNKTRQRKGYVFWDRFKSTPTRGLFYVKKLVLYFHANPLRAGIVKNVKELYMYYWSSHTAMTKKLNPFPWLNRDYTLSIFSIQEEYDSKDYYHALETYLHQPKENFNAREKEINRENPEPKLSSQVHDEEAAWVRETVQKAEQRRIMQEQLIQQPDIIQRLLDASCEAFSLSRENFNENIKNRTRKISSVIKLFSYWVIEKV
ncbi:MAG: transposase, partial [Chitinispirillia bacterium]